MEEKKLVNLAVDSLWYLTKEQVEFFNNKISLTFVIFSEVLENLKTKQTLSPFAQKVLFKNIILSPFVAAKEGIDMATIYNNEDANAVFDGSKLNLRGLARVRIIMGIKNEEVFDRKKNNDIHFAVSTPLLGFSLKNTQYEDKSLFEIMADFINARPQLHLGNENMVANTFINNAEYSEVMSRFNDVFEGYIAKLMLLYEQEVKKQAGSRLAYEIPAEIYRKISTKYKRYDFNSKTLLSSDFVQDIINSYKE